MLSRALNKTDLIMHGQKLSETILAIHITEVDISSECDKWTTSVGPNYF